ncbi:MAG TPA: hypothetical protein DIU39_08145 [Flavobacteriales bacterium]|nr:hypothetical protein [Flavobacteriales bacterium]|tara:strand:- start:35050 stop:36228 length:1179 start_codon:yes stop_codon:yes gene_type:complete
MKMKKYILVLPLMVLLIFTSCTSSRKLYEKGKYEQALRKSAKKLKKKPQKFEEADVFYAAYRTLFVQDSTLAANLENKNYPADAEKLLAIYTRMKQRQDLALSLPPLAGIKVREYDYSSKIGETKQKVAQLAYSKGLQLLTDARSSFDREKARQAYIKFQKAKNYGASQSDLPSLLAESKKLGTANVLFKVEKNANVILPKTLNEELINTPVEDLDREWVNYDNYIDTTVFYDYSVILNIQNIQVSPEQLNQKQYTETKEIEDGFEYVFDENGNVKKDSLGNDIKIPKYKTISCNVVEFFQRKTAIISGQLEYYDNRTQKLIKAEPITAQSVFENAYATANGNLNALKPETRKKLNLKPVPFPTDEAMVLQAGETLKKMTRDILVKNKNLFK